MATDFWREPWPLGYCLCRTEYGCQVHAPEIWDGLIAAEKRRVDKISQEWLDALREPARS